jgi:ubiquinone/menaquinone biosynthesis C-methylase UbiE
LGLIAPHAIYKHLTLVRISGGSGRIYGVELSELCVEKSSQRFKKLLKNKKLDITLGSVHNLPYGSSMFNSAFHVNTFFFFRRMNAACSELHRVLKPGAKLVSVVDLKYYSNLKKKQLLPFMTLDPINYMFSLESVGFTDVQVEYFKDDEDEYPAILATKPEKCP